MPNLPRLVAAVCLALLAFVLSRQIIASMPEHMDFGYFVQVNMAIGVLVGWNVMGRRAGRGATFAINNGLTGAAMLIFWGLFVQSCYEMIDRALHNRFDDPFEALGAIVEIATEYGMGLLLPNVILTTLLGALVSGLATEFAGRRSGRQSGRGSGRRWR